MKNETWEKVKEVFADVLEQPEHLREEFLKKSCDGDIEVLSEVKSLLEANKEPTPFLEENKINLSAFLIPENKKYIGKIFSQYKIIREIGHGGMGTVFLAERSDGEFTQEVAIKVVRQTIFDVELEKQFKRERQILASLNHPSIAKLLDGGVSVEGELFLVMEYVEGESLLDFVNSNNLPLEKRLDIFMKICSAVSYAHRNLVIHRDIKPSNILVTNDGEPKLLDFGLAKFLDPEVFGNKSTETATQLRAFTLAYASPEQISSGSVTTATDVYSLSVVLYELLTGTRPFHFENKTLEEILISVADTQPQKPSEIIATVIDKENLKSQIITTKSLQGDLDNICLMGLRKEPERRYLSVGNLSEDIKRHLKGLPVLARPQTFSYQSLKFIQRNKIAVSAVILVFLATLVGGLISFAQYQKAERERAKAEDVNNFLQKMLLMANPVSNSTDKKGYSMTINDMLDQATKKLETEELSNQPEIKVEIEELISKIYFDQGQYEQSEKLLLEVLRAKIKLFGIDSNNVLITNITLGNLYFSKANYNEAEKIFIQYLPRFREECQKGNFDPATLIVTINNYALLNRARGDLIQAEKLFRESLELAQKLSQKQVLRQVQTLITLTLLDQGKFDEAEINMRKLVAEVSQSNNNNDLDFASSLTLLGSILMEKGNLSEAESNLQKAEIIYKKC